ncbi:MAG TPA: DeoR/GlpR transcriptional regulator [Clostridiales bacterium]|jgi:DeoR family fructose operon transcriptional repressor|nr:DeoR/GlpR transcriptional regulator [Clostridiales bacterium]
MAGTAEERREKISEIIRKEGSVRVRELSRLFEVSEVTIRSDLENLEAQGQCRRNHGGAVGLEKLYIDMDITERYMSNSAQKKAIADAVSNLVEDNDTLLLNAGTTLTYVLRAIRGKKNISIITNSIANATEAASYPNMSVILLGGQIDSKYQFTYGADSISQLRRYHTLKSILSVDGIDPVSGLTLYYSNEAELVRTMIENSDTVIVAADSSKLGRSTFAKVAPVTSADIIVTNNTDNSELISKLESIGIEVINV